MPSVTNAGKTALAQMACGAASIPPFIYVANGSGSTPDSSEDTELQSENTLYGSARAVATCTVTGSTIKWELGLTFSGTVTIRELGIFNEDDLMLYRHVYTEDTVFNNLDNATIVIEIPVS